MMGGLSKRGDFWVFVQVNAFFQWLIFVVSAGQLLRLVLPSPTLWDSSLMSAYCLCLCMTIAAAGFVALCLVSAALGRRITLGLAALFAALLMAAILVDVKLYRLLGVHLYSPISIQTLRNPHPEQIVHLGRPSMAMLGGLLLVLIGLEWLLARWCTRYWRRLGRDQQVRRLSVGAAVSLLVLLSSGLLVAAQHQRTVDPRSAMSRVLPLQEILFDESMETGLPIADYPHTSALPHMARRPNVVFVVAESLRSDVLGPSLMPHLSQLAADSRCIRSARHYSGSHVTQHGLFSLLYGLYSSYYMPFAEQQVPSYPLQVLRHNGYVVAGASSAPMLTYADAAWMLKQLAPYHEPQNVDDTADVRDADLVSWAKGFEKQRDPTQPFFLFLFFDSTHYPYFYPPEFARSQPTRPPEKFNYLFSSPVSTEFRQQLKNRYDNGVRYIDHLFSQVQEVFAKEWQQDDLIVVFTGDHGEEFWESGVLGHSDPRFINPEIQVPLVLCVPRGEDGVPKVGLSSHVDLLPTILDYGGLSPRLSERAYSNGASLLQKLPEDRVIAISGSGFPFVNHRACITDDRYKFWLFNDIPLSDAYKVVRAADLDDHPATESAWRAQFQRDQAVISPEFRMFFRH